MLEVCWKHEALLLLLMETNLFLSASDAVDRCSDSRFILRSVQSTMDECGWLDGCLTGCVICLIDSCAWVHLWFRNVNRMVFLSFQFSDTNIATQVGIGSGCMFSVSSILSRLYEWRELRRVQCSICQRVLRGSPLVKYDPSVGIGSKFCFSNFRVFPKGCNILPYIAFVQILIQCLYKSWHCVVVLFIQIFHHGVCHKGHVWKLLEFFFCILLYMKKIQYNFFILCLSCGQYW